MNQMIDYAEEIINILKLLQKDFKSQIIKKLCEHDLTIPQMTLMHELYKTPNISLNELSKRLSLSKSTVSGIVDRLEKSGFVIREIPAENRRTVKISLSDKALEQQNFKQYKLEYLRDLAAVLEILGVEETEKVIASFKKLNEAAQIYKSKQLKE